MKNKHNIMKKLILLFVFILLAIICDAQTEHMKFAGIPLNGTMIQFQTKLQAKGYKPQVKLNSSLPEGTRAFKGTFIGKEAEVPVHYDPQSKLVYSAKAYFENYTEEKAKEEVEYLKNMLLLKYEDGFVTEDSKDGMTVYLIDTTLGNIAVYPKKDETLTGYPFHFSVHLEYSDKLNSRKHYSSIMDDL